MIKKKILFLLVFGLSKSIVFLAPLLLAEHMSVNDYGKVEYSIAGLGFILNTILNFGIPSSYGYFILTKKDNSIKEGYNFYVILLMLYFLLTQGAYFFVPEEVYLSLTISYILSNQVFYSYVSKAENKAIKATLFDSGIYYTLILMAVACLAIYERIQFSYLLPAIFIYAFGYFVYGFISNRNIRIKDALKSFYKIIGYSWHILIGSFLTILLLNSGRFFLEFFSEDYEQLAIFGFYLRISGISLVLFQVFYTLYFKDFFTKSIKVLDSYFAFFLFFILLYSVVSFYFLPPILMLFSDFFSRTYPNNESIFYFLTFFAFFWTSYNLFSNIIVREGFMNRSNVYMLVVLLVFVVLGIALFNKMNALTFASIQLIIGILVVLSQLLLLRIKGFFFKRSLAVVVTASVFSICYLIYQ